MSAAPMRVSSAVLRSAGINAKRSVSAAIACVCFVVSGVTVDGACRSLSAQTGPTSRINLGFSRTARDLSDYSVPEKRWASGPHVSMEWMGSGRTSMSVTVARCQFPDVVTNPILIDRTAPMPRFDVVPGTALASSRGEPTSLSEATALTIGAEGRRYLVGGAKSGGAFVGAGVAVVHLSNPYESDWRPGLSAVAGYQRQVSRHFSVFGQARFDDVGLRTPGGTPKSPKWLAPMTVGAGFSP